jgi:hypothetical protein
MFTCNALQCQGSQLCGALLARTRFAYSQRRKQESVALTLQQRHTTVLGGLCQAATADVQMVWPLRRWWWQ